MVGKLPLSQLQSRILIGTAILASLGVAPQVFAQQASSLEEVVVTATKRDEMVQDVPVAVTALTQEVLETNQVVSVNDLSGLAPNMTVRPAAGGTNIPSFNMRGITSYGVVAGSDKQVSVYLDGVYIGSPRGSIFSLPDIQQLEVLRGPQGTLFGRNATGGAISITTRSPSGQLGFRQKVTGGSRDLLSTETTIDSPAFGDFSAYITYTKETQDGDIKNLGAGTVWDRTPLGYGTAKSPKTLGEKDNESIFLSALFEPSDVFNLSYKFDYATDRGSPAGTAIVGNVYPAGVGAAAAPLVAGLAAINNPNPGSNPLVYGKTRPDEVNNAYSIYRDQKVQGHNLTATWNIRDDLTLKNTFGYREVQVWAPSDLTATSGWVLGPLGAAFGGLPADTNFCYVCTQPDSEGDQWSNEIQVDYDTDFVTVVAGGLYYKSSDRSGGPRNAVNTVQFGVFPGHVIGYSTQGVSYNDAESYAVFSQAEFHITDALDVQAGLRYTYDDKSGDFVSGNDNVGLTHFPFKYDNENVSYLLGTTYDITEDLMVYAKWSTAFVSGGSVAGLGFDPEEVESWEVGSKAEFFDGRLRSNIAIFDATYEHLQSAQSGQNVATAPPGVGVLIVDGGELDVSGVEWEVTALPIPGLTISAGLGYQNAEIKDGSPDPATLQSVWANPNPIGTGIYLPGSTYEQTLAPEWNGNLSVNYETNPLFGSAYLSLGVTGQWQDKVRLEPNKPRAEIFDIEYIPERWVVNARAALKGIELGGGWQGELAVWGRNLTDDDSLNYITNFGAFAGGTFQEERTYGIDLVVKY